MNQVEASLRIIHKLYIGIVKPLNRGLQVDNVIWGICIIMVLACPKTIHRPAIGGKRLLHKVNRML